MYAGQEPTAKASGLVMVVAMQILTRLSIFGLLPVSGYKNGWMHALVQSSSPEPLNGMFLKGTKPDSACRRALNTVKVVVCRR